MNENAIKPVILGLLLMAGGFAGYATVDRILWSSVYSGLLRSSADQDLHKGELFLEVAKGNLESERFDDDIRAFVRISAYLESGYSEEKNSAGAYNRTLIRMLKQHQGTLSKPLEIDAGGDFVSRRLYETIGE